MLWIGVMRMCDSPQAWLSQGTTRKMNHKMANKLKNINIHFCYRYKKHLSNINV